MAEVELLLLVITLLPVVTLLLMEQLQQVGQDIIGTQVHKEVQDTEVIKILVTTVQEYLVKEIMVDLVGIL